MLILLKALISIWNLLKSITCWRIQYGRKFKNLDLPQVKGLITFTYQNTQTLPLHIELTSQISWLENELWRIFLVWVDHNRTFWFLHHIQQLPDSDIVCRLWDQMILGQTLVQFWCRNLPTCNLKACHWCMSRKTHRKTSLINIIDLPRAKNSTIMPYWPIILHRFV